MRLVNLNPNTMSQNTTKYAQRFKRTFSLKDIFTFWKPYRVFEAKMTVKVNGKIKKVDAEEVWMQVNYNQPDGCQIERDCVLVGKLPSINGVPINWRKTYWAILPIEAAKPKKRRVGTPKKKK